MNFNNELNYAKTLESTDFSKDRDYFSKCVTLIRYWRTIGVDDSEINKYLYDILKTIYFDFSESIIYADMENMFKIANNKGNLENKVIRFSKEELEYIHSFKHLNFEKMLFIMFCAYKVEENNMFTIKLRELMRLAGNAYSKKYCTTLLHKSYKNKIFDMDSYNNTLKYFPTQKTLDLFTDNIILEIDNFDNLVYYYLQYLGNGRYFNCVHCGRIDKLNANNQKYCSPCAKYIKNEQNKSYSYYIAKKNRNSNSI